MRITSNPSNLISSSYILALNHRKMKIVDNWWESGSESSTYWSWAVLCKKKNFSHPVPSLPLSSSPFPSLSIFSLPSSIPPLPLPTLFSSFHSLPSCSVLFSVPCLFHSLPSFVRPYFVSTSSSPPFAFVSFPVPSSLLSFSLLYPSVQGWGHWKLLRGDWVEHFVHYDSWWEQI